MSKRVLARRVDALARAGACLVVENEATAVVSDLSAASLRELFDLAAAAELGSRITDAEGHEWRLDEAEEPLQPFRLTIEKPVRGDGCVLLTETALGDWLDAGRSYSRWRVAALERGFDTWGARFGPWDDEADFEPRPLTKSPRDLVREATTVRLVPADIRPWILTDAAAEGTAWEGGAWAARSAVALIRSLADEIEAPGGGLLFRGPPRLRVDRPDHHTIDFLGPEGFGAVQRAATWVYEDQAQAETRHGLFSDAFVRASGARTDPGALFRAAADDALAGAKIAHQLGLSGLGREAVKAMSDLRKAVADETGKVSDVTRQTVANVAGASAIEIGLIAAKLGANANDQLIRWLAAAGAIYILGVVFSGQAFVAGQHRLRRAWRKRLYKFIPDEEYKDLVKVPSAQAERGFWIAAVAGGLVVILLATIAFLA